MTVSIAAGSFTTELELAERIELTAPAGTVTVVGRALRGPDELASDERTVVLAAGGLQEIVLDLLPDTGDAGPSDGSVMDATVADTGVPELRSPVISTTLRLRGEDIGGSDLIGRQRQDEAAFTAFRNQAETALGGSVSISAAEVSLQLLLNSTGVSALDELWDQTVTVAAEREDMTAFVELASGDPSSLEMIAGEVGTLGSDRFNITASGHTPRSTSDDFEAWVRVDVVYVGR